MWCRDQEQDGGNHGEQGEEDEAESIQDHGGKLPVALSGVRIIVAANFLCDHAELF